MDKLRRSNHWKLDNSHLLLVSASKIDIKKLFLNNWLFFQVNGLTKNLPFSLASRGLTVSLSGINIIMTTRFGLTIRYNGRFNFFVRLSGAYQGWVEGEG